MSWPRLGAEGNSPVGPGRDGVSLTPVAKIPRQPERQVANRADAGIVAAQHQSIAPGADGLRGAGEPQRYPAVRAASATRRSTLP